MPQNLITNRKVLNLKTEDNAERPYFADNDKHDPMCTHIYIYPFISENS